MRGNLIPLRRRANWAAFFNRELTSSHSRDAPELLQTPAAYFPDVRNACAELLPSREHPCDNNQAITMRLISSIILGPTALSMRRLGWHGRKIKHPCLPEHTYPRTRVGIAVALCLAQSNVAATRVQHPRKRPATIPRRC